MRLVLGLDVLNLDPGLLEAANSIIVEFQLFFQFPDALRLLVDCASQLGVIGLQIAPLVEFVPLGHSVARLGGLQIGCRVLL